MMLVKKMSKADREFFDRILKGESGFARIVEKFGKLSSSKITRYFCTIGYGKTLAKSFDSDSLGGLV